MLHPNCGYLHNPQGCPEVVSSLFFKFRSSLEVMIENVGKKKRFFSIFAYAKNVYTKVYVTKKLDRNLKKSDETSILWPRGLENSHRFCCRSKIVARLFESNLGQNRKKPKIFTQMCPYLKKLRSDHKKLNGNRFLMSFYI